MILWVIYTWPLSEIPHVASWTEASGCFHSKALAWIGPHSVKSHHMTCGWAEGPGTPQGGKLQKSQGGGKVTQPRLHLSSGGLEVQLPVLA